MHGLYRLAANLAGDAPLVLVIDDLDMADAATLRFILYLVGRLDAVPVALLVACGSAVPGHGRDILDEVLAHPATRRCAVEPLGPEGTAGWLRASFFPDADAAFCAALHDASGGSPWLIGELCRELAAAGVTPNEAAVGAIEAAAPESVGATVMRRARAIEPAAAALLEAAAVLGPDAELRHAAGLTGLERNRVATLADALAAIGVLAGGERLTFAQPAVGAAVHRSLPAAERAEAHLWAARALHDDDAPAEPVADHLLRAAKGGGAWVTGTLQTAAARALATGATRRAVELLERALREPPPPDQRAHVLLDLGRAQAIAGDPGALARLAEAIDRLPAADERAATALETGRTLMSLGRLEDAAAAFELGARYAGEGERDVAGLLAAGRATAVRLERGAVERPSVPVPEHGHTASSRAVLAQLALDAALRGDSHETVRVLASRALARGALLDDDTAEGIAYYLATAALTVAEDLQMAEAALAAAVNDARSRGSALALATASHFQSFAIMRRGRVHAAAAAARAALEGERHGWRLACPPLTWCWPLRWPRRATWTGRRRRSSSPARMPRRTPRPASPIARAVRSCTSTRGRPQEALADFTVCGELLEAAGAPNPAVLAWRSGRGSGAGRAGRSLRGS